MGETGAKNMAVFSDVIMSLVSDAAADVEGIKVLCSPKGEKKMVRGGGVQVYFLPNDKVSVDLFVNIKVGYLVPEAVSEVQEKVKSAVEGATKFKVHSVNVQVVSVIA